MLVCACLLATASMAGCGGSDDGTTGTSTETTATDSTPEIQKPTEVRVVVENGVPKGGIFRQKVDKGDQVVLVVTSDVADEIHLHGYDLSRDVAAGGTARLRFTANVPDRFEVELESRGVQIADLTVNS